MYSLQSSFFTMAVAICLLCAAVAATARTSRRLHFLVAYLLLEAARFLFQWLMVEPQMPAKSLWLGLLMASSFLVAPTLWLLAREVVEPRAPSWGAFRGSHLAVVAAGVVLLVPLLLTAHSGTGFARPGTALSAWQSRLVPATMLAAAVLFVCQVPYYLRACLRLLERQDALSRSMFSNLQPTNASMLRLLGAIVCANWLVGVARSLHCLLIGADAGLGIVFCVVEVSATAAVLCMLIGRTAVFSIEERTLAEALVPTNLPACEPVAAKYARSALDEPTRRRIRRKLDEVTASQQLHRDPQITLRGLCAALKENPHYVSQVINQDLGTNFYDLMKKARIDDAKALLITQPDSTVLEVGLTVGFNAKSTFNAAFKQQTGMTPSTYRRGGAMLASPA